MSKSNISAKKAVFLLSAVVLIALTYFLIYQKNMDDVWETEASIRNLETRIMELESKAVRVAEMEKTSGEKQTETEQYLSMFAPILTQEKTIYHIYQMSVSSGIQVSSIDFGNYTTFFRDGKVSKEGEEFETGQNQNQTDSTNTDTSDASSIDNITNQTAPSSGSKEEEEGTIERNSALVTIMEPTDYLVEQDEIDGLLDTEKKPLNQMTGRVLNCSVEINGNYRQCMKAMDWIVANKEKMAVGPVSLTYDNSNGKLSGRISIDFYEMAGTGNPYVPPNLQGFQYGIDNVFRAK